MRRPPEEQRLEGEAHLEQPALLEPAELPPQSCRALQHQLLLRQGVSQ